MPLAEFFSNRGAQVSDVTRENVAENQDRIAEFHSTASDWLPPEDVEITDLTIDGPHGRIPIRRYSKRGRLEPTAGLVWMHGGGFWMGTLDWAEAHAVAAMVSHLTGATVISVDYRLAVNGVTYPIPHDDVMAAWRWVDGNRLELGISSDLFIGGTSAGANLAAGVTLRLRDEGAPLPTGMVLAYGAFHFPNPGGTFELQEKLREVPGFVRMDDDVHVWAYSNYVGRIHNIPAYAAPGHGDLAGLPPTVLILCEYDDLRSSSEVFNLQLAEAGVETDVYLAEGMLHGHLNWFPSPEIPEVEATIRYISHWMGDHSATSW